MTAKDAAHESGSDDEQTDGGFVIERESGEQHDTEVVRE